MEGATTGNPEMQGQCKQGKAREDKFRQVGWEGDPGTFVNTWGNVSRAGKALLGKSGGREGATTGGSTVIQ